MSPFEEVAHTADLALRVWAPTLGAVFAEAAAGMFHLLGCEAGDAGSPVQREVELEAPDVETLLVDWLSELLYLSETFGECYHRFRVDLIGEGRLRGHVAGHAGAEALQDIKAVTYSYLSIEEGERGLETTLTFDV